MSLTSDYLMQPGMGPEGARPANALQFELGANANEILQALFAAIHDSRSNPLTRTAQLTGGTELAEATNHIALATLSDIYDILDQRCTNDETARSERTDQTWNQSEEINELLRAGFAEIIAKRQKQQRSGSL